MSVRRAVVKAFRAEFGHPEKKRHGANPWPKCPGCYHRQPDLCVSCGLCPGCCAKCTRCGECLLMCPGHEKEDRGEHR